MKFLIIANPTAGRGKERRVLRAAETLSGGQHSADIYWTQSPGDATDRSTRAVKEGGYDALVAAGGDGTINEVAQGVVGTDTPMGILALGTANCMAWETATPLDPVRAARTLIEAEARKVDIAAIDGRYFLLWAGIGFDGDVVHAINTEAKKRLGKLEFILKGAHLLRHFQADRITLTLDEKDTVEGYHAIVANTRYYAGRFKIAPQAGFEKEGLVAIVIQGDRATDIIRFSINVALGRHQRQKGVFIKRASKIDIHCDSQRCIQIDGDAFGTTPVSIRTVPQGLRILAAGNKRT